jgi:hypothetical protein
MAVLHLQLSLTSHLVWWISMKVEWKNKARTIRNDLLYKFVEENENPFELEWYSLPNKE